MRGHRGEGASHGRHRAKPGFSRCTARGLCGVALACSALLMTGCAVQVDKRGKVVLSPDTAAVLGTEHASFKLADGTSGTLRSLNGDYSLKLERYFRVIALGKKQDVRLASVVQQGERSVLVLHLVDERSNCLSTMVVSMLGSEVRQWGLPSGNCRVLPELDLSDGRLALRYADHAYVHDNGKLFRVKISPPETTAQPQPSKAPTPRSEAPQRRASPGSNTRPSTATVRNTPAPPSAPVPASTAVSRSVPVSVPAPVVATATGAVASARSAAQQRANLPGKLDFPSSGVEEKATVIVLDNKK